MEFNKHNDLAGQHAFLSPSSYHWINYSSDKLIERYTTYQAAIKGTELHAIASSLIKNKIKLANHKKALNLFVNDAIGFRMDSEVPLYYSENCFGTADAISFRNNKLMIFDLKTGKVKASYSQLDVYSALFCLEYNKSPYDIEIEERIYQGNAFTINLPSAELIEKIMNKVIDSDKIINKLRLEE